MCVCVAGALQGGIWEEQRKGLQRCGWHTRAAENQENTRPNQQRMSNNCVLLSFTYSYFLFFFLVAKLAFYFVPCKLYLLCSHKPKETRFIYLNFLSLFINELLTRSNNYLTLLEHLFSSTLPLLLYNHTCSNEVSALVAW